MITWLKEGTINGCGTALSWAADKWGIGGMERNLTGLKVERLHNPETTARDIAWLAAGRPDNRFVFPADTFHPRQDISLWQRYDLFSKYLRKRLELNRDSLPELK